VNDSPVDCQSRSDRRSEPRRGEKRAARSGATEEANPGGVRSAQRGAKRLKEVEAGESNPVGQAKKQWGRQRRPAIKQVRRTMFALMGK